MLTLLITAAPLSEKCKRSERIENGETRRPGTVDSRPVISAVSSRVSSSLQAESPRIVNMTCVSSRTATFVPAPPSSTTFYSEQRLTFVKTSSSSSSSSSSVGCRTATTCAARAVCCTTVGDLDGTLLPAGCMSPLASYSPFLLRPSIPSSPSSPSCENCSSSSYSSSSSSTTAGKPTAVESLKWCEARRIGSEPANLQSWLSVASLAEPSGVPAGCCRELEGEDDVFVVTGCGGEIEGDAWLCEELDDFEEEEIWLEGWEEFVIPSREISLTSVISHNCEETVFGGYWHGSVHVISRAARSGYDTRCFCREVAALNKIRHESIQLFMGITLDMGGGHLGLIMSPLKGESLHTRLHVHGHQFSMTSKFKIVKQICEGMEYLHSRGISHGRLCTSSVYIHNRVCIKFRPQVCLPRRVSCDDLVSLPPEDVRTLAHSGGSLMLPNPPALKPDIFAFGTLLYELVLLGKPFRNVSREGVIWRVGSGHLQPLSLLPRDRLRGIIQRCWQLNPESRPSFHSILSDVEQNVPVFSPQTNNGLQRSLSLPSVLTDPPSPTLIY